MVDYILTNNNDVNVRLRADAPDLNAAYFTILDISGNKYTTLDKSDTEKSVVNLSFRKGSTIHKQDLIDLATNNNLTLIGKVDGGTTINPSDTVIVSHTLGTPGSFAGTVNGATQITLNWTAVAGANGYVLERATNSGFTTGKTTLLDGSPASNVITKVDTGLTTATTYYYRIKAVGLNQTDSAYATDNKTTS